MSKARSSSVSVLSSIALAAALSSGALAGQERGRVLPIAAPLETGPENAILISNMSTNSILRVTDLSETGVQRGPTAGGLSLNKPWHFSLDAGRRIYLADRDNRRIVRMDDVAGTNWTAFSEGGGNIISQPNEQVVSTMVDGAGRIYITGSGRIGLVRIDNMSGTGWISLRVTSGGPKGVAMDGQGRIYVVDTSSGRIVRVNDMQGSGLVTFGTIGYGVGQFNRPEMVALDSAGRIYITDNENHRIVRINDMSGAGWTSIGSYGIGADQFSEPHDVKIDTANRIWIADTGNNRIVRMNSMAGDGWVTFGEQELQGRELGFNGTKGIQVIGLGPSLIYPAILPRLSIGTGFSTSIVAINTRPEGVDTQVAFLNGSQTGGCGQQALNCSTPFSASVGGVSAATFTQRVEPMGTSRFEVTSTTATPNSYARMTSTDDVDTVALLRTHRGTAIASQAGVRLSAPTRHFTVYIDQTNGASTGYTIVNGASQGAGVLLTGHAQVRLILRNKSGNVVDGRTVNLGPGHAFTELASAGFGHASPGFEGSVEVISNGKLLEGMALRYDNAAADTFTAMPVMLHRETAPVENFPGESPPTPPPAATTTLYYPHVGDGGTYRTSFLLANLTDAATTAQTHTKVMFNVADPEQAFTLSMMPNDGIGLVRIEFIIANHIGVHPMALVRYPNLQDKKAVAKIAEILAGGDPREFFVSRLAEGVGKIAAAFYPKPVIVRTSDFRTNEYARLLGGAEFEPAEENPMLGWRGASRYTDERYRDGFALECAALKRVRDEMGLVNVKAMIPFCRTVKEAEKVVAELARNGLKQGDNGLEIYAMCELPANVVRAGDFLKVFDGYSIGSNDLTQLVLGIDRDSETIAGLFDEEDAAVKDMISAVIKAAAEAGKPIGICGQAPSDRPEFAAWLVNEGITSVSLNPDSAIKTALVIAKAESTAQSRTANTN